jgi:hypothetical protein
VKLIGAGAENTILDGAGNDVVVYIERDAKISGFTITNSGIDWWDAGIWITDGTSFISENIITGNSLGISYYCYIPCTGKPKIENNLIFNNLADGIHINDGEAIIANNTIVNNGSNGISTNFQGTVIKNNIISSNDTVGVSNNNSALQLDNNNVWGNLVDYHNVTPGATDISADSKFVSPSTNNFHIPASSPNVDAGTNDVDITTDLDGDVRPYDGDKDGLPIIDIGADEYVQTSWEVFLPLGLMNLKYYFDGPWEEEPNSIFEQANGPLHSDQDYYGYHNDERDYFSFYMEVDGPIDIHLNSDHNAVDPTGYSVVQLALFDYNFNQIEYKVGPVVDIDYDGTKGWYYARVFTRSDYVDDTKQYTIRINYP